MRSQLAVWGLALASIVFTLFLVGCQAEPSAVAAIARVGEATATAANTRAAVVYTVAAPAEPPSFSLLGPEEVAATGTARSPVIPASPTADIFTTTPETRATLPASPVPSETPLPTFTPPALPFTAESEHYWLRRPVADGLATWTDKSYPYGHTLGGTLRPHHGVEFNVATGTEILAAASGIVRVAGEDNLVAYGPTTDFYGKLIVVELYSNLNGQPVFYLNGHLSEIMVSVGDSVDVSQVIGVSGSSGVAAGPHLHFEVRVGENRYDHTRNPALWLYPFNDRGTLAGRIVWPSGEMAHEVPIQLRRIDAKSSYAVSTSYSADGVNPDDRWNENFAFDDVVAGYYEVIAGSGETLFTEEVWVFPFRTSFVEIVLGEADSPIEQ